MKTKRPQDRLIFMVSLLSVSLFLMIAPQISSALPLMYSAFPGVSAAGVQMLSTVPNFGIVLGLVVSPFLVQLMWQKSTMLVGLLITLVAGVFPMFSGAYTPILVSRFLLGFGIGLFNSLAYSLIPEFYGDDEEKLATMVGIQNVMPSVGGAIASFLVSYLVTISWHAAFAIYFLVVPALIMFLLFVPLKGRETHVDQAAAAAKPKEKQSINGKVILIASLMFCIYIFYMPISYELPSLIVSGKFGTASTAAIVAGFSTLISIPIGAAFGYFFKKMHDLVFPLGFVLATLGFLIISLATNLVVLYAGVIVLGFGFGMANPYMYNWLDWSAPQNSVNLATTIVLVLVNVGCAISPTVVDTLAQWVHLGSPRGIMILSTIAYVIITIYACVHYLNVHKQRN